MSLLRVSLRDPLVRTGAILGLVWLAAVALMVASLSGGGCERCGLTRDSAVGTLPPNTSERGEPSNASESPSANTPTASPRTSRSTMTGPGSLSVKMDGGDSTRGPSKRTTQSLEPKAETTHTSVPATPGATEPQGQSSVPPDDGAEEPAASDPDPSTPDSGEGKDKGKKDKDKVKVPDLPDVVCGVPAPFLGSFVC